MSKPDEVRTGGPREYAKIALRSALNRVNLDLVKNPLPVRLNSAIDWLGIETVLDVGANIGQYGTSLRSSGFDGRLVSCEPLSAAYGILAKRSRTDERWTALNTAVGAEPGELEINVAANSYSSSILPMTDAHRHAAPGSDFVTVERVPVTTVAQVVADQGLDPARTFLKADTQGYEGPVLDGAGDLLGVFPMVQLELSMVPLYEGQPLFPAMVSRLSQAGYTIFAIEGGFSDERTGQMLQCDGIFVRSDLMPDPGSLR